MDNQNPPRKKRGKPHGGKPPAGKPVTGKPTTGEATAGYPVHSAARSMAKSTHPEFGKPSEKSAANPFHSAVYKAARPDLMKTTAPRIFEGKTEPVKVVILGGLNEIGKNMTMIEYGDDALLVDCGMEFPDETMLGVDIVLPDFSYVEKNKQRVRGIILTHGHEDHIGALAYLLKQVKLPVYGTRLTLALVESKLKEQGVQARHLLHVVEAGHTIKLGALAVSFIHVNHSIPDAVALAIKTPLGYVVHTGDFKVDFTPAQGDMIDLTRLAELGRQGVLALLCESTNAERPGYTPSEQVVGESFLNLFRKAENKRIIIATFSSNLNRIQQIIDTAILDDRKVAISGRSMVNFVTIATELGYLKVPDGVLIDIDLLNRYPQDKMIVITTGSQGEPMSALTRMAFSDHRKVEVGPGDLIIISATPIPGNEKTVGKVIDELMKRGCDVVYEKMYDVHVSGHACQEELKLMQALTKPQYFIPIHGEQKHLRKNAALARAMGIPPQNVVVADIGKVIALTPQKMEIIGSVPAGQVLVDGLGIGDVGSVVLRDRKHLAEDGLIVVAAVVDAAAGRLVSGPDMVSRGFVYVRESEQLMDDAKAMVRQILLDCLRDRNRDFGLMKARVRDELSHMLFAKTKRSPMILPVIEEI
ncbi:MAG: ribonuclease J [Oscillospiraceae bacterium]|nr:ribonuclease J [Oscillospiraceae bacterium]